MRKENFKRSFWNMTKFWGISNKTWLDTIRPMAIWTTMYFIISYFSGSFDPKNIYFTAFAVIIISIIVFCFCFIFITPSQIYNDQEAKFTNLINEQQKKINAQQNTIDNLTKKSNNREAKDKLVLELRSIWGEGYSEDVFYKMLTAMRRDKLIPESLIDDFVNYPPHKDFLIHYNDVLRKIIDHLKW